LPPGIAAPDLFGLPWWNDQGAIQTCQTVAQPGECLLSLLLLVSVVATGSHQSEHQQAADNEWKESYVLWFHGKSPLIMQGEHEQSVPQA
jgi:hypothetical protein